MDAPGRPYASAGGLKLEAAIEEFRLFAYIYGSHALDVGAGGGGFTDCLLQHGAQHVTAIDVGRGQMPSSLRDDPRVTLLEGVHIKRASVRHVAPGPFDFFTCDVSFMAGRSALRPIAMRLKPGAHGVVLVKPQFELPKKLVPPGGVVKSKNLRKFAFNRFKKAAARRGFHIIEKMDSPTPGAAGNVEILTHLAYVGQPGRAEGAPQ